MDTHPMELFQREAPEVAAAFNNLIQALVASRGIDQKTKQLIYIAMKASSVMIQQSGRISPWLKPQVRPGKK